VNAAQLLKALPFPPAGNSSIAEALSMMQSSSFVEEMRMVEEQAAQSASFVALMAAQSATLLAERRKMEHLLRAKSGGALGGPLYNFPHMHVAGRRRPAQDGNATAGAVGADGQGAGLQGGPASPQPLGDILEDAPWSQTAPAVGSLRVGLTLTTLVLVILSALVTANRKWLMQLAKKRFKKVAGSLSSSAGRVGAVGGAGGAAGSLLPIPVVLQEDEHEFAEGAEEESKGLSVWDGTVVTFSSIVGTGLLAMPYAFSLAGMVAVPIIIFFVCCSAYTAHLMAWSMNATGRAGWGALVEAAFGQRAKVAINAFLIVELWGYLLSSIVCTSMNVAQLVDGLSISAAVGVSVLTTYALSFVPRGLLTKVNIVSNLTFIACLAMFIVTGLLLPAKAPVSDVQYLKPSGILSAAGILVFSPAGHSFYPALMQRMEEPAKFPTCLRRAYVAACLLYLVVAVPGYYLFGNATQPSAVRNIGVDLAMNPLPDLGWMNCVAALCMVVKMLALQTLVLMPLVSTVEGVLQEGVLQDHGKGVEGELHSVVAPAVLMLTAAVAAHFADAMATLLNLIGSVFCMNIAFVVPVLCYWRLATEPLGWLRHFAFVGLVAMGGTFGVLGVLAAL